jgi:hypothetical protein
LGPCAAADRVNNATQVAAKASLEHRPKTEKFVSEKEFILRVLSKGEEAISWQMHISAVFATGQAQQKKDRRLGVNHPLRV